MTHARYRAYDADGTVVDSGGVTDGAAIVSATDASVCLVVAYSGDEDSEVVSDSLKVNIPAGASAEVNFGGQ